MANLDSVGTAGGLRTRTSGSILWIELDRPSRHNALDAQLFSALADAVAWAVDDPAIRVFVVGAAGDGAFCAGADLDELSGLDVDAAHALIHRGQAVFQAIADAPIPSIAAVNGAAIGGGFELALSCTLTIGSHRSSFGLPETGLGLMPGYGGTQRLPRAVGPATALRLMLTGERLDADEASARGFLAARPMAPALLSDEVCRVAELIAGRAPAATARVLEAVRGAAAPELGGLAHEASLAALCISSLEAAEGIAAFKERRQAQFPDRWIGGRPTPALADPAIPASTNGAA